MNYWLIYFLLWVGDHLSFDKNNKRNEFRVSVQQAVQQKQYGRATTYLQEITQLSLLQKTEVTFDLAQAYFESHQLPAAQQAFERIRYTDNKDVASTVWQQLGIIYTSQGDTTRGLDALKSALILKPENEIARYNFELLSKKFTPKPQKQQTQQTQPKEEKVERPTPQKELELAEKAKQQELLKKLNEYHLTQEKALTILETIKNAEVQYVQQRKRSVSNKKEAVSGEWW